MMIYVVQGRGGSDGCKFPVKIESLAGLGVVKVECGSQVKNVAHLMFAASLTMF